MIVNREPAGVSRSALRRMLLPALVPGLGLMLGGAAAAQASSLGVNYSISLAGLTIGKASLSGTLQPTAYALNASATFTGLVGAVSKGQGSATARGQLDAGSVLTNGFSLTADNGKQSRSIQIGATSGNVRGVTIEPPFEPGPPDDRVPLRDAHRAGVVDPLSALVMPALAADPFDKANCERRLPVFDGTQRFDVVLSYVGTRQVKGDAGYNGQVLVCAARYVPVAGHRPSRKALKFMVENRNMDAWLVPVDGGKVLIPYRISVKTMIGTSVIEAQRFVGAAAR